MTASLDEFDAIIDDVDFEENEEAYRRPVRTPSRRGSFQSRSSGSASQGQVQATARSLDAKIETLSTAVRTLETRVNGIAATQSKSGVLLRRESTERRKALEGVRADLQQTKMLSALLPMLTTETVDVVLTPSGSGFLAGPGAAGATVGTTTRKFLVQPDNQLATLLPLFLLMQPPAGTDGAKSGFDPMMLMLFVALKK